MINFSEDTPAWIKELVEWTAATLMPDWDIEVKMTSEENEEYPDSKGEIEVVSEYFRAFITYHTSLKNNHDGQVRVVHELCHPFFGRLEAVAKSLITSKLIEKKLWKHYEDAEEEAVVRLSKILIQLRSKSVDAQREP
jgi:hypothetical protein